MKRQWVLSLTVLLALVGGAQAQSPTATIPPDPNGNLIGLQTANGRLVYDFINLWFNEHQAAAAWDKYVARHGYMNHAVYNATTKTVKVMLRESSPASSATRAHHW